MWAFVPVCERSSLAELSATCVDGPAALAFVVALSVAWCLKRRKTSDVWYGCVVAAWLVALLELGRVVFAVVVGAQREAAGAAIRWVAWVLCSSVVRHAPRLCLVFAVVETGLAGLVLDLRRGPVDRVLWAGRFVGAAAALVCIVADVLDLTPKPVALADDELEAPLVVADEPVQNVLIEEHTSVFGGEDEEMGLDDNPGEQVKDTRPKKKRSVTPRPAQVETPAVVVDTQVFVKVTGWSEVRGEVVYDLEVRRGADQRAVRRRRDHLELACTMFLPDPRLPAVGDDHATAVTVFIERNLQRALPDQRDKLATALMMSAAVESSNDPLSFVETATPRKAPTLLSLDDDLDAEVTGLAVCDAAGIGEALRESYGTLASGRILYRIDVTLSGKPGWRCVKTFAQLRALVAHANRLSGTAVATLQRPQRPNATRVWIEGDDAVFEADKALELVLRACKPRCLAALLFLETDIVDRFGKPCWDLVLADNGGVEWRECDAASDEKRRKASAAQLDKDAAAHALNVANDAIELKESDEEVGDLAHRAASLAIAMLAAVHAPISRTAHVAGRDQAFFERVDHDADARLFRGGDGKSAHADLISDSPVDHVAASKLAPRRNARRSASLPPRALAKMPNFTNESDQPNFDDGSTGGVWVTLARYRTALLHTSAWLEFRTLVAMLCAARPLDEKGDTGAARAARAATLANLHAALSVHVVLAWGAGSGRPGSTERCNVKARYVVSRLKTDALVDDAPTVVPGVSIGALELALLRKKPTEAERLALKAARLLGPSESARAVDLRAALVLASARASSAPLAVFAPRPPDLARAQLRWAARTVLDASLDVFRGSALLDNAKVDDDEDLTTTRDSFTETSRASIMDHARGGVGDPMTTRHRDSLLDDRRTTMTPPVPPSTPPPRVGGIVMPRLSPLKAVPEDEDAVVLVLPYDMKRHASVAARRPWTSHAVARGKRRRARRAALLKTRQSPAASSPGGDDWAAAAENVRRRERYEAAKRHHKRKSLFEDAARSDSEDATSEHHSSVATSSVRPSSVRSDDDDLASSSSSAADYHDDADDPLVVADTSKRRTAAFRNLMDFLVATGGAHTESRLKAAASPQAQLHDTASGGAPERLPTLRFRPPDFRPAIRLLPQPPPNSHPLLDDDDDLVPFALH